MEDEAKSKKELIEELKVLRKIFIENKLNHSEEGFNFLFDNARDGYYISDLEGTFIDGNRTVERITGYHKEELIGKNYAQAGLLLAGDISKARGVLKRNKKGLVTGPEEFVLQRKDRKSIEVEVSSYPIKINSRMLVLGIARDVSEVKRLECALENSEKERSVILESSPMHILYEDRDHKIIWATRTACDSVNKTMEELKGKTCYQVWAERDKPCEGCPVDKTWKTGKMERGEMMTPDGRCWAVDGIPVMNEKNEMIGAMKNALDITELRQSQEKLQNTMDAIIETIAKISEIRDPYTAGHQYRVSQLSIRIAQELHLSKERIEGVRIASLLHDIGKIGIPSEILTKPSKLGDIEFALIKKHPEIGYDILKDIDFPYPIAQIVLQHHERNDGSGYPNQLKGDEIFLEAKIIGVADVVEAMSSHRPYHAALGVDKALEEISKNRGILYEVEAVDVCLKLFREKGFKFE